MEEEASKYLNENVLTTEAALNGAKDIIAERISEEKDFRQALRDNLDRYGFIVSNIKKNAVDEKQVYTLYYDKRDLLAMSRAVNTKNTPIMLTTVDVKTPAETYNAFIGIFSLP